MHGRFEPELSALAAGLAFAALDWICLLASPGGTGAGPLLASLAVTLFAASLVALVWRTAGALLRLLDGGLRMQLLVGGVLCLPVVVYVSYRLFQGTAISRRWYAPYGPYLVAPILFSLAVLAIALGTRLLPLARRSVRGRVTLGALLMAGSAALALADLRLYPNQYAYLHAVLALASSLGLLGVAWLALPAAATPSRWRLVAPALLTAAWPAFVLAAWAGVHGQSEMQLLAEHTRMSGRLAALCRDFLDRDHDHYSIVFGEHDCDNHDPAVHPFALEVPGNGVDEDCDGRDGQRRPPAAVARGFSEYPAVVERLSRQPTMQELLGRTGGFNVMLVMIDALRADQVLPTADNHRNHPRLMRLVQESRSFVRAFSTGAGTDIGMATIFTGQLDAFDRRHQSLFQSYQQAGFDTYGVFQREVERWVGRQFSMQGLAGRKVVINDPGRRDVGTQPTSGQVSDEGIRYLRRRARQPGRFFLWLHYFDAHEHHQIDPGRLPEPATYRAARGRPFYRSLLRFIDQQLGRVLDELQASGLAERTIVALAGDHGESLGENPERLPANHGDVLFNPLVHVPMALHIPRLPGGEVRLAVSLADLGPTLLDLSGIRRPGQSYGVSLLPYLLGSVPEELRGLVRPVVMYETRQRALLLWPWKFITWLDSGRVELYQVERDFAETHNLADQQSERIQEMARQLASYRIAKIDRLANRR